MADEIGIRTVFSRKHVRFFLAFALLAIPAIGTWELLVTPHVKHLLTIFAVFELLAIAVLVTEYFSMRKLWSEAKIAHHRLQMAMTSGKVVGWEWDLTTGRDDWFGDLRTMFGIQSDTWSSHIDDFFKYVHPEDRKRVSEAVATARRDRAPYRAEFRVVHPDGSVRWIRATGSFYYAKNGNAERMLGSAVDITERKQVEEELAKDITERRDTEAALRTSTERLRLAMQAGRMYVDEWEISSNRITRSAEAAEVLGKDVPLQTTMSQVLTQVHLDDRKTLEHFADQMTPEHPIAQISYRLLRPDGTMLWLEKRARGLFDESGRLVRAISAVADITERKQSEQALRASEERFRRVVEHISDALTIDNVAGQIIFANDRFLELFGLTREQRKDLKIEDYVAPEYRPELRDRHDRRMRGESVTTHFEYEGVRVDGKRIWLEVDVVPIVGQEGEIVGTQSATREITERKRVAQSLRESEEMFRFVANSAPVMIWIDGPDQLCSYVNQQWLNFTGRPLDAELGTGWAEDIHPEDLRACLDTYSQAFHRREAFDMQYRLRRHDGQYRWIEDRAAPRFNADGSFAGFIGSCYDVTERKLAEQTLQSVGRRLIEAHEQERTWIARELHDDTCQRLALLTIELARWSQEVPESGVDIRKHFEQARKALFDISKDVQALSHRLHSSKLEYLGLATGAKSFCREFSEQHNVRVEFTHTDIPTDLSAEVSLSLFRVMQEALQNSIKHSQANRFEVMLRGDGADITLKVSDHGTGFDQREAVTSRGLGLVSMRERLQLVNGSLVIESKPGEGTTIRARVPIQPRDRGELSAAV